VYGYQKTIMLHIRAVCGYNIMDEVHMLVDIVFWIAFVFIGSKVLFFRKIYFNFTYVNN
jgi:hypothetical protein